MMSIRLRNNLFAFVSILTLAPCGVASAQSDELATFKRQIIDVSTRELRKMGDDPQQYRVHLISRVDECCGAYLDAQKIDRKGIWVVEFVPRPIPGMLAGGGEVQFYFRYPSTALITYSLGQ